MPRYHLSVRDGGTLYRDEEGQELPDAETACQEAAHALREVLAEAILCGSLMDHHGIEISDERGLVLDRIGAIDILFSRDQLRLFVQDIGR